MKLKILSIRNQGDHKNEYVRLKATADCNLRDYAICDSTYTSTGKLSNRVKHTYWFPSKALDEGDYIRLHTTVGTDKETINSDGSMTYHYYWNLKVSVWNDDGDSATLVQIAARKSHKVEDTKEK